MSESFKKEDLKFGDIVILRYGNKLIYDGHLLVNPLLKFHLKYFNKDLKHIKGEKSLDIMKVERPVKLTRAENENQKIELIKVYERKEEILDKVEKEYLSAVIKPFRNKVEYIKKEYDCANDRDCILINLEDDCIYLPHFKPNTMYKAMKLDEKYSLQELGL